MNTTGKTIKNKILKLSCVYYVDCGIKESGTNIFRNGDDVFIFS